VPAVRTLSARILIGFAVLILTFGVTSVYVVIYVHDVGEEVRVIRERYLELAFKAKDFARSEQDLLSYLSEDRTDEPYARVQLRVKFWHKKRVEEYAELRQVLERLGPVPDRHERRITDTRARIEHVGKAITELEPDYAWFFALSMTDASTASLRGVLRRFQFDVMMKHLLVGEQEVSSRAKAVATKQEQLVVRLAQSLEYNEARLLKFTIYLGGSAIIVGLLITVWATFSLRPLRRLRDAARRIAAGDYASRIEERGPVEVADLAREFNVMGQAVEERERELVRSERLAAVGKMAALITHEVRNPLSSIALNTELLEDELDGQSAEARALCRAITREVDRLTALTEEYLAFARLPQPKLVVEQANDVVGSLAQFVREDLMARGVALEVTLAPDLPLGRLDPSQLRQCLLNLIRNATEAVAGRPQPRVAIATRAADATIEIEVSDNGPGIAPDIAARLFDPFVSSKQGGTGLGLALTHQIISDHGGELRVASHPDRGATFTVVLPQAREVAIAAAGG
jgi:two-component system, NtrC family, sensor kinase